jgi:hypothetical protein
VHAQFFLISGDTLESLDGISVPRETTLNYDGSHVGGPSTDIPDEQRLHTYIHTLVEHTELLAKTHAISRIDVVMPAEIEHALNEHLSRSVSEKIKVRLHLDLMNVSPLELVQRVVVG